MFEFCALASGSSGNSAVLGLDGEYSLVDAGISLKKIEEHLRGRNIAPENIRRLFLTHAHSDHAKSAGLWARKYDAQLCLSRETYHSLKNFKNEDLADCRLHFLRDSEQFGALRVKIFRLPHLGHEPDGGDDAGGAIGFLFAAGGFRMGYFTDLGALPDYIIKEIRGCDFLFLEANHDVRWEKAARRPAWVIARNLSDFGHLSNEQAARIVERVVDSRTRAVMFAHISRDCNSHELIKQAVKKVLPAEFMAQKIFFAPEGRCSEH
ncbi:MAG: MBL fold metallo-hydrolase, partial [Candidatus Margulisbacteria bacterium]|nr:MBL fold metallo-hydrolase [Candidatus Margulisiibacteriota bacterium]